MVNHIFVSCIDNRKSFFLRLISAILDVPHYIDNVWEHGPISLNCPFLEFCPCLKVIQLFSMSSTAPGDMGSWGVVKSSVNRSCYASRYVVKKALPTTSKSVHLYALPNFICFSERKNKMCTPIKTRTIFWILWSRAINMSTSKLVTIYKLGLL